MHHQTPPDFFLCNSSLSLLFSPPNLYSTPHRTPPRRLCPAAVLSSTRCLLSAFLSLRLQSPQPLSFKNNDDDGRKCFSFQSSARLRMMWRMMRRSTQ
ncbi:hypothetical protein Droror1_Dr00000239, partial [Drosera rotundifolia]